MEMDHLTAFLTMYRELVIGLIFVAISLVFLVKQWNNVKLWWLNTWMSMPFIGKIRKLSKDGSTVEFGGEKWFNSEVALCDDYFGFYRRYRVDPARYHNAKSYLQKAQELGRKPFPFYMWLLVFLMVIIEALGFAYVLAGYTLPGASERLQQEGAFGIALLLSVLLVAFTHFAGHEMYKNSVIRKIRVWFENDRENRKRNLRPDNKVNLENDHIDNDAPIYNQLLNRIKDVNAEVRPSWYITLITAFFIIAIAIGATYVRGQVLEKELTQRVANQAEMIYEDEFPEELGTVQKEADSKAKQDIVESEKKGGWATFIVLAILFVFIQLLGILFGYRWGFVGKESRDAYEIYSKYATLDDYIDYFRQREQKIKKIAQNKLTTLQTFLRKNVASHRGDDQDMLEDRQNRTFEHYVQIRNQKSIEVETLKPKKDSDTVVSDTPTTVKNIASSPKRVQQIESQHEEDKCPACGHRVPEDAKFCPACGNPRAIEVPILCSSCGQELEPGMKFCPKCGEKVALS